MAKSSSTPIKNLQNADTQTSSKSPTKHPRLFASRQPLFRAFESESDFDVSMQEERRIEFQQRRLRQMQKKKCQNRSSDTRYESQNQSDMRFDHQNQSEASHNRNDMRLDNLNCSDVRLEPLSTPNFAIGSPTTPVATAPTTKTPAISSFFPAVPSNKTQMNAFSNKITAFSIESSQGDDATDGRRVAVVGGDDVFIPRLDLDELVITVQFFNPLKCVGPDLIFPGTSTAGIWGKIHLFKTDRMNLSQSSASNPTHRIVTVLFRPTRKGCCLLKYIAVVEELTARGASSRPEAEGPTKV